MELVNIEDLKKGHFYKMIFEDYHWIICFDRLESDELYDLYCIDIDNSMYYGISNVDGWAYLDSDYELREATDEEIHHLKVCRENNCFILFSKAMKTFKEILQWEW